MCHICFYYMKYFTSNACLKKKIKNTYIILLETTGKFVQILEVYLFTNNMFMNKFQDVHIFIILSLIYLYLLPSTRP